MNPKESIKLTFFLIPIKIISPNDIRYNIRSLLNIPELTNISFPLKTTNPNTKDVTNMPLPIRLFIENWIPSSSPEATKDDITSEAPFPKASNVTAAIFWLILNVSTILVIEVLKNISLVEESIKNKINNNKIDIIEVNIKDPFIKQK